MSANTTFAVFTWVTGSLKVTCGKTLGETPVAPLGGLTFTTWGKEHEAAVVGGVGEHETRTLLLPPASTTRKLIDADTFPRVSGSWALATIVYVPGVPRGLSPWARALSSRGSGMPFVVSPASGFTMASCAPLIEAPSTVKLDLKAITTWVFVCRMPDTGTRRFLLFASSVNS